MIRNCLLLPALLLISASLVHAVELPTTELPTTELLFNGSDLTGWDADPKHWRVEAGAIVGEIAAGTTLQKNTWLVWQGGIISDFELRARFKLTGGPGANSGIQIRCQVENVDHVSGYQADLDLGTVWLGRLYDEHGRALLVERGNRVHVASDGSRRTQSFAPANHYGVLFREGAWNDYRIVAVGDRIDVYVNGTLFSQLKDEQSGEQDLSGSLAFQLHSGGETRIEFRDIQLDRLKPVDANRLSKFEIVEHQFDESSDRGHYAVDDRGVNIDLGFESGSQLNWTATGNAFEGQPVDSDGIASRWAGQTSNKNGRYFIGGFEKLRDGGIGTLTSCTFKVTHPYASFLLGGGNTPASRVELLTVSDSGETSLVFTAVGENREQMRLVVADLRSLQGSDLQVRLIDESNGAWGHLNFDDFRFHDQPPLPVEPAHVWRSTFNPLLQHLIPNPLSMDATHPAANTLAQMYVPDGFSVDVIAAEPDIHQPIAFTFDAKGRLWVVEGHSYPQKRPTGQGLDRVVILSDEDSNGSFETRDVFIEGLNLVSGIEVGYGGVWIGAAPELLFIPDRNGDDRPDSPAQVLLDGFALADTHETLNSFMWGPDGWLYGNQGVFNTSAIGKPDSADDQRVSLSAGVWRYHPRRHEFEVFAHGGSNQWGLDYDQHGQIFMTHCRSYWGQGLTTHVIQGGHFWNQVNGGYAPFISPQSIAGLPLTKNYLLASARYGHGEGGAGQSGSRVVFGGHSHVGTMIYLGDNWPSEYRNHLFTLNLHGHQINHQVNQRVAGGYDTVHAGKDVLFCADPQFIGVDLQVGPDGAVYISDWYDPRHCHNPNTELWDRGNGRIYRMKYDAHFKTPPVDYLSASDLELAETLLHRNDWHVRTALRLLAERAAERKLSADVLKRLTELASTHPDESVRLRGIWALHVVSSLNAELMEQLLADPSESVRGWAIQLGCEAAHQTTHAARIARHATTETNLFVRRYLASAIQRLPNSVAWEVAETLAMQADNQQDRDLPLLLWQGLAGLAVRDLERALILADKTPIEQIRNSILWYAAKTSEQGRDELTDRLTKSNLNQQPGLLRLFAHALTGMRGLTAPPQWPTLASDLYAAEDSSLRSAAESLGAAFGDEALFAHMRQVLSDNSATIAAKRHAMTLLMHDDSESNQAVFLKLIDHPELNTLALPMLRRYDDSAIPNRVITLLPSWDGDSNAAALELLCSRSSWAVQLLDAIRDGSIPKARLTAYFARQMANLGDEALNARLANEWGNIGQSSAELRDEITKTANAYKSAPLWAYQADVGQQHFQRLCAACHQPSQSDERLAPKLNGTGSKGIDYIIENVIDPNAVIGRDFQARLVLTSNGQVVTGLVQSETDSAVTLKTATNSVTIAKADIDEIRVSENSFMPTGLLETLNERERIELFKYLMSL